ncbi:MAG: alpha/beta hydrolase, partial [Coxiellaceae bacterium]|nr:alpha/beta hydrolase [Coxiellaceae bacterium]
MTMAVYEVNTFQRDVFPLQYQAVGCGAPAIVIGSHQYYPKTFTQPLFEHLRCYFMDHRGFVLPDTPVTEADFSLDKLLDDIEAFRVALSLDRVILIGHSIHALIALEYAKKFPASLSHLVLIASSPIAGNALHAIANQCFEESVCKERKQQLMHNIQIANSEDASENAFIARMIMLAPMIWYDYNFTGEALWQDVYLHPFGAEVIWNK